MSKYNDPNNRFSALAEDDEIEDIENSEDEEMPDLIPIEDGVLEDDVAVKTILNEIDSKRPYSDDTIDYLLEAQIPTEVDLGAINLSKKENAEELRNFINDFNENPKAKQIIIPIRTQDGRFTALSLTKNNDGTPPSATYIDPRGTEQKASPSLLQSGINWMFAAKDTNPKTTEIGSLPIHIRNILISTSKISPKDITFTTNKIQQPTDNIGEPFLVEILKNLATGQMTVTNKSLHEKGRDLGNFSPEMSRKAEKISRLKDAKQLVADHPELSSRRLEKSSERIIDNHQGASITSVMSAAVAATLLASESGSKYLRGSGSQSNTGSLSLDIGNNIKTQDIPRIKSSSPSFPPTLEPTNSPTTQTPSLQPSFQPTAKPTTRPTGQPSSQPAAQPSSKPSGHPSTQPSRYPSSQPTSQPSNQPSGKPSSAPTEVPTSSRPTSQPSTQPSTQPISQPTAQPSAQPSIQPSGKPSSQPSAQPSIQPSGKPSSQPSTQPISQPTAQPSDQPSIQPSGKPSSQPSAQPSTQPSARSSNKSSSRPTPAPSRITSTQPSSQPSAEPSNQTSSQPSSEPSSQPTSKPTSVPTNTFAPSNNATTVSANTFAAEAVAVLVPLTESASAGFVGVTTQSLGISNLGFTGVTESALINSGVTSLTKLTLLSAGLTTLTGGVVGAIVGGSMDAEVATNNRRLTTTGNVSSKGTDSNSDTKKSYAAAGTEIGAIAGFASTVISSVARYGFTPESHIAPLVALILTQNEETFQNNGDYKGKDLTEKVNHSLDYVSHFHWASSSADKLKLGEALEFAFEHIMAPQKRGGCDKAPVKDFIAQFKDKETHLETLRKRFAEIFSGRGTKFSDEFFEAQGKDRDMRKDNDYLKGSPAILAQAIENCLKLQNRHVIPVAAFSHERNLLVNAHDLIDHYHKMDKQDKKPKDLNPKSSLYEGYARRLGLSKTKDSNSL